MVTDCEVPPELAVMAPLVVAATVLVWRRRVPDTPPAGISTLDGTGIAAFVLLSVMAVPAAGAGPLKVTVSVTADPPLTEDGFTDTDTTVGVTTGARVTLAVFVTPLYVAVTVTGVEAVTADGCTRTLAALCPAGTTTSAGTGKALLLLKSVTDAPPDGAAALSCTVRTAGAPAPGFSETLTELRVGNTTGVIVMLAV
jgi:hypothetical protein